LSTGQADDAFADVLAELLPDPIVQVRGSNQVDVSPRTLNGRLTIHLVNTSGPHAKPPAKGIAQIPPVGPLTVTVRLPSAPGSIVQQPEGRSLAVAWRDNRATVTLPKLDLYSILVVEP
jgi:hypothetical protein